MKKKNNNKKHVLFVRSKFHFVVARLIIIKKKKPVLHGVLLATSFTSLKRPRAHDASKGSASFPAKSRFYFIKVTDEKKKGGGKEKNRETTASVATTADGAFRTARILFFCAARPLPRDS